MRALVCLLAIMPFAASADGLMDRAVGFGTLVYEDRDAPIFTGIRHGAIVSDEVEYGLAPEGEQNGWDVVSAIVDIGDDTVRISYPDWTAGRFPDTTFNGYVLDFMTDCVLFADAAQDTANSTTVLGDGAIFVEGAALYIDVGGVDYGADTVISVTLDVQDCPMS